MKKKSLEERLIEIRNNPIHLTIEDMDIQKKNTTGDKNKSRLRGFRFGLSAFGIIFILLALFYDYNTSSLVYREGIVAEVKVSGESIRRKGVHDAYHFKIEGDTTTYDCTCEYPRSMLPLFSLAMDIKQLEHQGMLKGDNVGFWLKPNEKSQYEFYLKDDYWSTHYKKYSRRKLPYDKAYAIKIRGLSINSKMILKPPYYNYVREGSYYPMLCAFIFTISLLLGLFLSLFLKKNS